MFGDNARAAPAAWRQIQARTAALGFDMPSEVNTGALLRLRTYPGLTSVAMDWASGLIVAAKG